MIKMMGLLKFLNNLCATRRASRHCSGKGGQTLKRIGMMARHELEDVFDRKVHLLSHVKYRKDWMDDKHDIKIGI